MKQIGILTFHKANNYGAVLQAFALSNYLNSIDGVKAELINYCSPVIEQRNAQLPFAHDIHQSIKKQFKGLLNYRCISSARKSFDSFRNQYIPLSEPVTKENIKDVSSKYDVLICGSDQIWNLDITENDYVYFLDFCVDNQVKFSYAASIGDSSIIDRYSTNYKESLSKFSVISVRESSTKDTLEKLLGYPIRMDVDPVFLLGQNTWTKIAEEPGRQSYILAFRMGTHKSGEKILDFAQALGKEKGLKVLYLSDKEVWYKHKSVEHYGVASPLQFLGLIQNAEAVVTNSFHATAFSLIFNRDIFVNTNIPRAERIKDLLQMAGIEGRTITLYNAHEKLPEINWENVNEKLLEKTRYSANYLHKICNP